MEIIHDETKRRTDVLTEPDAEYLSARAVDATAASEAGVFWSARKAAQIPREFSNRQRRGAPALIAALHSPDGQTVAYQMRPRYKTGKGPKWMSPPAERAPVVLGAHPAMLESIRSGSGALWAVEGITRAAALAARGIPSVAFAGCWSWLQDGKPLSCWDHVNLKGRPVYVTPDADYRTNPNVQSAISKLVGFLETAGADVWVVDVPEVNCDAHAGLDDALANGYTPAALAAAAQRFCPVDVARVRVAKSERLRQALVQLWAAWQDMPVRRQPECSERSVMRELIAEAQRTGKTTADGIRVRASQRSLAIAAGMSKGAAYNATLRLQAKGYLTAVSEPDRPKEKAQAYTLTLGRALRGHIRGETRQEKETKEQGIEEKPLIERELYTRDHVMRGVPELRWSKTLVHRERDNRGQVVETFEHLARLGKKRAEIVRYCLEAESVVRRDELVETFGTNGDRRRPRDFMRRTIGPMVDAGILETVETERGQGVQPAATWQDGIEHARELGAEQRDARLQVDRITRERGAFRDKDRDKHDVEPDMRPIEDKRQTFAFHPNGCACEECSKRFGRVISEHVAGCACAACFGERKAAARKAGRRVVPLPSRAVRDPLPERDPNRKPAPVTVLREVRESRPPSPVPANSRRLTPDEVQHVQKLMDEGWDAKEAGDYVRGRRVPAAGIGGDVG